MDENLNEIFVSTEKIYTGKVVNLRRDIVCLPNGREASREVVEHPGAVAIVPVLPDGRIVLVRQFRHPVGKVLIEIPAGKLDKGGSARSLRIAGIGGRNRIPRRIVGV